MADLIQTKNDSEFILFVVFTKVCVFKPSFPAKRKA